jgi:hypothetical protein
MDGRRTLPMDGRGQGTKALARKVSAVVIVSDIDRKKSITVSISDASFAFPGKWRQIAVSMWK